MKGEKQQEPARKIVQCHYIRDLYLERRIVQDYHDFFEGNKEDLREHSHILLDLEDVFAIAVVLDNYEIRKFTFKHG